MNTLTKLLLGDPNHVLKVEDLVAELSGHGPGNGLEEDAQLPHEPPHVHADHAALADDFEL